MSSNVKLLSAIELNTMLKYTSIWKNAQASLKAKLGFKPFLVKRLKALG